MSGSRAALFSRNQPGGVFNIVDIDQHPGDVWFVDSGVGVDAAGYGQNPDAPFATLDYAIGQTTANNGDVIYVMPGHAETYDGNGEGFDLDVNGVKVIILGEGADRATFTFSHVGANCTMSGDSCSIKGFPRFITGIDSVVNMLAVTGDDPDINLEILDTTDVEVIDPVIATSVNRLKANLIHRGYTGGNANNSTIALDGVAGADILVWAEGKAGVAVVDMRGHACSGVKADGTWRVAGTALTKNVVDTITGSDWVAHGYDAEGGYRFVGSDNKALATDDYSAVTPAATAITGANNNNNAFDSTLVVANADGSIVERLEYLQGELGASVGASISADIAAVKTETAAINADVGNPSARTNFQSLEAMVGVPDAANSCLDDIVRTGYDSSAIAANADGSLAERLEYLQRSMEVCVEKSDGSVPLGDDDLFTIAGGPVVVTEFVGYVATQIGADATTCTIQEAVTAPAGDVALSTAVNIEGDAVGTTYTFTAATPGVLTPTTAGARDQLPKNYWLLTPGTLQATFSAATTGVIKWYMRYRPLSPNSVVTAAA
jgi:hypothetical protein